MLSSQVIKKAYHLVKNPSNWTNSADARDINNIPCHATSSKAVKWCASSALFIACLKCYGGNTSEFYSSMDSNNNPYFAANTFLKQAACELGFGGYFGIVNLNDKLGHEAVLFMFRLAYRIARRAEAKQNL